MSSIVQDTSKGSYKNYLNDVTFLYARVQRPTLKYEKKDEYEYVIDCVVDEDTADKWEELYPKSSVKKHKTAIFEDKYGIAPPFPDAKNQYIVKVKADSHYKDGNLVSYDKPSRPKILVPVDGGVKDITMDISVGNGSKGDVSYRVMTNSFGDFPKLTRVLVKDLIEYEGGGDDAFGTVVNASEATDKALSKEFASAANTDTEADKSQESEPVLDDNDPF